MKDVGRRIVVKGKVQGVFYRASTQREAKLLGIVGEVRNLSNGDVEIKAYGTKESIDKLVLWCNSGPQLSKVDKVHIYEIAFEDLKEFKISY